MNPLAAATVPRHLNSSSSSSATSVVIALFIRMIVHGARSVVCSSRWCVFESRNAVFIIY